MKGPVLSHSPLEGSGGVVMNSRTMCDGQMKTIATLYESNGNGASVFAMKSSNIYWDHDSWRLGVIDISPDGSNICIPGRVVVF